jgi:hypothetical protein
VTRGRTVPWLVLMVAAVALGGCGSSLYVGSEAGDPAMNELGCAQPADEPSGMLVLLAQSVPDASAVPCLRTPVGNWTMGELDAHNGAAMINFQYQFGGGDHATIELRPDCDVTGAREVASPFAGTRQYDRDLTRAGRYANEIYFVYAGGCTSLRFDMTATGAELRGGEIAGSLGFLPRADLDRQIRAASDGHLRLDPD